MITCLVATPSGTIQAQEIPPEAPDRSQVRIAVRFASVSLRTDARPVAIGTELSGVVVETPDTGSRLQLGDRVAVAVRHGACVTQAVVPEVAPIPLPDTCSLEHGVLLPGSGIFAIAAVTEAVADPAAPVVVLGANSATGWIAAGLLRCRGVTAVLVGPDPDQVATLVGHGYDAVTTPEILERGIDGIAPSAVVIDLAPREIFAGPLFADRPEASVIRLRHPNRRPPPADTEPWARYVDPIAFIGQDPARIVREVDALALLLGSGQVPVPLDIVDHADAPALGFDPWSRPRNGKLLIRMSHDT